jgi:hypothetical protein
MAEDTKISEIIQLDNKEIAKLNAVQAHAQKARETDIGTIGRWLGSRDNAVIYLAAGVLVFAILMAGFISIFESTVRADMVKALISIATLAAGVMAGAGIQRSNGQS